MNTVRTKKSIFGIKLTNITIHLGAQTYDNERKFIAKVSAPEHCIRNSFINNDNIIYTSTKRHKLLITILNKIVNIKKGRAHSKYPV